MKEKIPTIGAISFIVAVILTIVHPVLFVTGNKINSILFQIWILSIFIVIVLLKLDKN